MKICGILGVYSKSWDGIRISKKIRKAFEKQKLRGEESFGCVICNLNETPIKLKRYRSLKLEPVLMYIQQRTQKDSFVLFHHRQSTSTEVHKKLTHPFISEDRKIGLIHNGIIAQHTAYYNSLKKKHKFETAHLEQSNINFININRKNRIDYEENINDSEVLLHIYEDEGIKGIAGVYGSVSTIIIDIRKEPKLILYRNSMMPLEITKINDNILISSEEYNPYSKTIPLEREISIYEEGIILEGDIYPSNYTEICYVNENVVNPRLIDYNGSSIWDEWDKEFDEKENEFETNERWLNKINKDIVRYKQEDKYYNNEEQNRRALDEMM